MHGQPLQPSKMDDWSSTAIKSWAPINCTMETLLHIVLQQNPLGSLEEFRNNTMVALQQHCPQGTTLTPQFFNHEDTEGEKKSRKISYLICRATGLQTPVTAREGHSGHSYPCQDPASHLARTGTSGRLEPLNELVRSTSFTLIICTIPYSKGHIGLQRNRNPPAAAPFLLDIKDTTPVYRLMHQTFCDNLQQGHLTEVMAESRNTLAALGTERTRVNLIPSPRFRKVWASSQRSMEDPLIWQRVILIQDGKDK